MEGRWKSKYASAGDDRKKEMTYGKENCGCGERREPQIIAESIFLFYGLFLAAGFLWRWWLVFLFCFGFFFAQPVWFTATNEKVVGGMMGESWKSHERGLEKKGGTTK